MIGGDGLGWRNDESLRTATRPVSDGIVEYVRTGLSNGRSEGVNSKARTITKRSYGFGRPSSLIAYIYLCCTGIRLSAVRHYPT